MITYDKRKKEIWGLIEMEKVKKEWYKSWWAIIIFVFFGFGILMGFIEGMTGKQLVSETTQPTQITKTEVTLFSGEVKDILDSYEDTIPQEYTVDIEENSITASKLNEAILASVQKFDSVDAAKSKYAEIESEVRSGRGYSTIEFDNCIGKEMSLLFNTILDVACIEKNIIYKVQMQGTWISKSDLKKQANELKNSLK